MSQGMGVWLSSVWFSSTWFGSIYLVWLGLFWFALLRVQSGVHRSSDKTYIMIAGNFRFGFLSLFLPIKDLPSK